MQQIQFIGISPEQLVSMIEKLIELKFPLKQSPAANSHQEYLSRKEAAGLLKISLPTLNDWTKLGLLKSYKIGSRVLYRKEEIVLSLESLQKMKNKRF